VSGDGVMETYEKVSAKIYLVGRGITGGGEVRIIFVGDDLCIGDNIGGVRGYSVPSLWVPWTQGQGCMVHCSLAGTDRSSHCDRGTGWTRAMPSSLHSSPLCTGALSDWSL
jgi:hypothetical protein